MNLTNYNHVKSIEQILFFIKARTKIGVDKILQYILYKHLTILKYYGFLKRNYETYIYMSDVCILLSFLHTNV